MKHLVLTISSPLLMALQLLFAPSLFGQSKCGDCHADVRPIHGRSTVACTSCHQGRAEATLIEEGHEGLIARPGELGNAGVSCGQCHPEQWSGVHTSPMHTGRGMVTVTRRVFGEPSDLEPSLQTLGSGIADSLLRKLCASCHLGQAGVAIGAPGGEPVGHRGGGCLACHLNLETTDRAHADHPQLTRRISDARCLGCHSRSARIALNYAGLAEVDPPGAGESWVGLSRLADRRLVEHKPADVHHQAGLSCVDCHTGAGLMGLAPGVDIACVDCHANQRAPIATNELPAGLQRQRRQLNLATNDEVSVPLTARGTPLWHLSIREKLVWLHPKSGNPARRIPQIEMGHFDASEQHRHLSCAACHSTWAPQCYGCHLDFDPRQSQWDHVEHRETEGRWVERRWAVHNGLPPLGVDGQGVVRPVTPGMIMTADHPDLSSSLFVRRFSAIAPHTTGRSRVCDDCHGSARALGLGKGVLRRRGGAWSFAPSQPILIDGLAADAWTALTGKARVRGADNMRPFSTDELRRLLAPIGQ